ncbi:MAG: hypothetical protein ABIQ18_35755 [Umezawaea sp.]
MNTSVIRFDELAEQLVYVSGDNAALELVEEIAAKFAPVDTAVLFLGGARFAQFFGGSTITLNSAQGPEAVKILGARPLRQLGPFSRKAVR